MNADRYIQTSGMLFAHGSNSARVHSKRWSRCRNLPAGRVGNRALYSSSDVVTTRPRFANSKTERAQKLQPGGVEVLDHFDNGRSVKAFSRLSRYINEPWISSKRARCFSPS